MIRKQQAEMASKSRKKSPWKKIGHQRTETKQKSQNQSDQNINKTSLQLQIRILEKSQGKGTTKQVKLVPKSYKKQAFESKTMKTRKKNTETIEREKLPIKCMTQSIYVEDPSKEEGSKKVMEKNYLMKIIRCLLEEVSKLKKDLEYEKLISREQIKNVSHMIQLGILEFKDHQQKIQKMQNQKLKQQSEEIEKLKLVIKNMKQTSEAQEAEKSKFLDSSSSNLSFYKENSKFTVQKMSRPQNVNNNLELIKKQLNEIKDLNQSARGKRTDGNYSQIRQQAKTMNYSRRQIEYPVKLKKGLNKLKSYSFNTEYQIHEESYSNDKLRDKIQSIIEKKGIGENSEDKSSVQPKEMGEITALKKKLSKLKNTIQGIQ